MCATASLFSLWTCAWCQLCALPKYLPVKLFFAVFGLKIFWRFATEEEEEEDRKRTICETVNEEVMCVLLLCRRCCWLLLYIRLSMKFREDKRKWPLYVLSFVAQRCLNPQLNFYPTLMLQARILWRGRQRKMHKRTEQNVKPNAERNKWENETVLLWTWARAI